MKRIWVLSVILFCLTPPLSAIENYLPNIAHEIFDTHVKTATEFIRGHEQELKTASRIIGSSLKISGALLLFTGVHQLFANLLTIARPGRFKEPIITWKHLLSPHVWMDKNATENTVVEVPIAAPPYLTALSYLNALFISAYLLGMGSYELYREINALIKEYKQNNPAPVTIAEVTPPPTISMQEESLSASDTISMT